MLLPSYRDRLVQFVSEQKSILVGRNVHPVIDVTLSVPLGTHYHADVIYFIRVKDESKRQAYTVYEIKPCYADPPFSISEKKVFFLLQILTFKAFARGVHVCVPACVVRL